MDRRENKPTEITKLDGKVKRVDWLLMRYIVTIQFILGKLKVDAP
jgi:hypothetical protein